ncbi:YicC family protein [Paenibacillus sp. S3N08]|uniref:YicC family protein n=1 Tax=Paenibacillus agricola TaxID=2716264 RepID=A0ABX0J055_9BACL|nr:YicC family protein [Paenibacillus agricola]
MITSMTGFGQANCMFAGYHVQIDLKSVNHRYCEVAVRMPREFLKFEDMMKKIVLKHVKRGRVDMLVTIEQSAEAVRSVELNWPLAEAYRSAAEQLSARFGLKPTLNVRDYLEIPNLMVFKEAIHATDEEFERELSACSEAAVQMLLRMRKIEGNHLSTDMKQRLDMMASYLEQCRLLSPQVVKHYASKLHTRIEEYLQQPIFDEARLAMEVAIFADRSNVDEELIRLQSHIQQCQQLVSASEPVGRKFDFLLQEMNREVNTIGSKANHAELTTVVVEMKAELEKMREQIQNIE